MLGASVGIDAAGWAEALAESLSRTKVALFHWRWGAELTR